MALSQAVLSIPLCFVGRCNGQKLTKVDLEGPDISLEDWDWYDVCGLLGSELMNRAIVGWCFLSAYSVAYHLLMVMVSILLGHKAGLIIQQACVCSVYVMIHYTTAGEVSDHSKSLRDVCIAWPRILHC